MDSSLGSSELQGEADCPGRETMSAQCGVQPVGQIGLIWAVSILAELDVYCPDEGLSGQVPDGEGKYGSAVLPHLLNVPDVPSNRLFRACPSI